MEVARPGVIVAVDRPPCADSDIMPGSARSGCRTTVPSPVGLPDVEESAGAEYQILRLRGGPESNGTAGSTRMASTVAAYSGINSWSRRSVNASDPSGRFSGASMPTKVTGSSGGRPFHIVTSVRARHRSTR